MSSPLFMRLFPSLAWCALLIIPAVLADGEIRESSGLAVDSRGVLWTLNDGPNIGEKVADNHIYALDEEGTLVRRVKIAARNSDWEDLAAFSYNGKHHLLIADTGDNLERRTESVLHVIEEPAGDTAQVAWKIRFHYPDTPHDCEAVAVDSEKNRVLLVTKRGAASYIYSVPISPAKSRQTAVQLGTVWPLPQSSLWVRITHPLLGRYTHQVTGLDISRDGRLAVAVTYDDAYLWRRKKGESLEQALAREPNRVIVLPDVRQYEGVAFSRDARSIYVSEEGSGTIMVVNIGE